MDKKVIGKTGIMASRLGFGAMRLPQKDGGIDFSLASEMVDVAIDAGINYFDTGYNYHHGKSESFLGESLKKYARDQYIMTTKLSLLALDRIEHVTRAHAEAMFDEQLARLGIECFDFYFIHNISNDNRRKMMMDLDLLAMLTERKRRGQLRFTGFSFHDKAENMAKTLDMYDWDLAQIQLNYYDWEAQNAELTCKTLSERGVPFIAMEPVRGGRLVSLNQNAEHTLREANPDESNAGWALRWVANKTGADVVLSGMSSMQQLKENIDIFSPVKTFTQTEQSAINVAARLLLDAPVVGCTACEYCLPCPEGIKIPKYFDIYNEYIRFGNAHNFKTRYDQIKEDTMGIAACTACGKCVGDCPQMVNVPDEFKKMLAVYNQA